MTKEAWENVPSRVVRILCNVSIVVYELRKSLRLQVGQEGLNSYIFSSLLFKAPLLECFSNQYSTVVIGVVAKLISVWVWKKLFN